MSRRCDNCEFWESLNEELTREGECRALPPKPRREPEGHGDALVLLTASWPLTRASDWCGAWQRKE